jgi:gamma-glutamyl:cysteine ligase YbdK (ATP-grasp superfamily)
MGQEIASSQFSEEDFTEFQHRLEAETLLLEQWFNDGLFSDEQFVAGFELEACLLDEALDPAPINQAFLDRLDDPLVFPELAVFNIEMNSTPRQLSGDVFSRMAQELGQVWGHCRDIADDLQARPAMVGILPTLQQEDLTLMNMSPLNRYQALNEQVFKMRRDQPVELKIDGVSPLQLYHADVMLESAATSFQIHLQVSATLAAKLYNLSKAVSAPMVAVSANSPFLFRHDLWDETRIPLFEQAISIGASDLTKRVSFGIRYVYESIMENFTANLRRYPVLLPRLMEEPVERLAHLRLHNGTIWRWNRPLIGFDEAGKPHLRIEHRVVPSGPSVVDCIANMAFYFGMIRELATLQDDDSMPVDFSQARSNFYEAARRGLEARLEWSGATVDAKTLLQKHLLPLSREGLRRLGVNESEIKQWLGVIEDRVESGQTGARWQREWIGRHGASMHGLLQAYLERQESGMPVNLWSLK